MPTQIWIDAAKEITSSLSKLWDVKLETILTFCVSDPSMFPRRGKTLISDVSQVNRQYLVSYINNYYKEREGTIELQEVGTKADPVVNEVLSAFRNVPKEELAFYEKAHRLSMQAENIVGKLLERYIAGYLESKGWVWCCGDTVRSVDFLNVMNVLPRLLQVKNRDNSENSSSSAIRAGTTIEKWYRIKSRTGGTCWEQLPDNEDLVLIEKGFYTFVHDSARKLRTTES